METLRKNQIHTGEITGLTSEGAGVCRIGGRAVFVPGALPGEQWEILLVKVTATAVWGKGLRNLSPAPERREPDCPHYEKCGGCSLRHMHYAAELEQKRRRVNDAFQRIGHLDFSVSEIIGADSPDGYRNKCIYAVGDGPVTGFFQPRSHQIIPISRCLLQSPAADYAARALREWMQAHQIPAYQEQAGRGLIRHLFFREGNAQAQVTIVANGAAPAQAEDLVQRLRAAVPALKSVVWNRNETRGNTILAGSFHALWGTMEIETRLCGHRFSLSPQAFCQINIPQAEKLYRRAMEYTGHADTALDLYCGAGTITLCLAKQCARVYGAEIVPEAIENAKANARSNGIENTHFLCADAGEAAQHFADTGIRPQVIVVDPPRKGLRPDVIETLAAMAPERIVYVSCNPATLARDLKQFSDLGYAPQAATAVDMFPRTPHIETVVRLVREDVR